MKKQINTGFFYAIMAMVTGVGYRQFIRIREFTGETALSQAPAYLFVLGALFFLVVASFEQRHALTSERRYSTFNVSYNLGLIALATAMIWQGILQVLNPGLALVDTNPTANTTITVIYAVGRALMAIGIVLFFLLLIARTTKDKEKKARAKVQREKELAAQRAKAKKEAGKKGKKETSKKAEAKKSAKDVKEEADADDEDEDEDASDADDDEETDSEE